MSNLNHNPIIKNIPLKDIKPYSNNPRKKQNITKVVNSIKEFGFQQPIVVDKKNIIIVGHSRYEAGKELGLDKVPVIIADLSPVKAKAYRIADNRINQDSEWDFSKLTLEFKDISKLDFNLDSLGFEKNELDDLIIDEVKGFTDDDAVPDKPKKPKSKLGEIYQLGHHRLMCGDATKEEDINKLMDGTKADMVFTDPPYNVSFNGRSGKFYVSKNDNLSDVSFTQFIEQILQNLKKLNINTYYICCNWSFYGILQKQLKPKACIVWAKNVFGLGRGYRHQHEFILFDGFIDASIKNESDLWNIAKDSQYQHPTQKPVALSLRALKNSSREKNIVLDLFGGSGSTLIGCEKLDRICYMMELDPKYCDVIVKRWEQWTGEKATK